MKQFIIAFVCVAITVNLSAQQRTIAECTINYSISASGVADKDLATSLLASTKTVYIKGNNSRVELVSPSFSQTTIYDKNTGTTTILKEMGNTKIMSKLDKNKWAIENRKFDDAKLIISNDAKTIVGYDCHKAVLQLKDGSNFVIYYSVAIVPTVKEFEYQFKDVPGLVLEYEITDATGSKIKYTATKINLSPVQVNKFDIPTSGYRIMSNQ